MAPRDASIGEGAAPRRLIEIPATKSKSSVARSKAASPAHFWAKYYREHDESPTDLREKITLLNVNKKFADVQAILIAYLNYRHKNAQPWMYPALALAMEENKAKPEEIRKIFGYSADAARQSQNPNHMVSAADLLYLHKQYDLVGPLLDEANAKVPQRGEPILMSINLAQATQDPKRMTESVEKLLAQGWPINDEAVRRDARRQVEKLAKTLREEGRGDDAARMLDALTASEARDLFIRLTWTGDADFDLYVDEPLGATASYVTPRTPFGGAIVRNGFGTHPEEVYVCPRGFDGTYQIRVVPVYNNPARPATAASLEVIRHEGSPQEVKESHTLTFPNSSDLPRLEPVSVTLKGGRRTTILPVVMPIEEVVASPRNAAPARAASDATARKSTSKPR